jgi:hypothetical protein
VLRVSGKPRAVVVQESFNGAKSWVKELQRRAEPNIVIALAGNKADLKERAVERDVRDAVSLFRRVVSSPTRMRRDVTCALASTAST